MPRLLPVALVALLLPACANEPVATSPSNNPNVEVDTLFTHEGCTVYRFRDGVLHYYVRCQDGRTASNASTFMCRGKHCGAPEEVQTVSIAP